MAWIGDVVPYAERQPVLARFLLGQILGLGVGAAVGGVAAEQEMWRWPFAVLALWLLAMALAVLAASRGARAAHASGGTSFVHHLASVVSMRWARIVVGTVFVEGMVVFGALSFVPTHLHQARGFALSRAGLAILLFAGGGVIFALAARPVVRRLGEAGLAVAGTSFIACGLALTAWTPVAFVAPVGCLLAGLGFYMLHNTLQTNATQMVPEHRGAGMAFFASMYFVGQALGVAAAGYFAERFGAVAVVMAGAVAVLPVGLNFARLRASKPGTHPGISS
jgi:predicted MFS family arabinose efflux permease